MTVKPWIARLYPESTSSLFCRVQVWPTHRAFLSHLNRNSYTRRGDVFDANCRGTCTRYVAYEIEPGKPDVRSRCFAIVNLRQDCLTMEVVTHELFHATMAWGYRIRFPFCALNDAAGVTQTEERITYAHSTICRMFMVKASRANAPYDKLDRDGRR